MHSRLRSVVHCVAALLVVPTLIAVSASPATAGMLDQQQPEQAQFCLLVNQGQTVAQTFTAGVTGHLDQVDVGLATFGEGPPAGPLNVQIRTVESGVPSALVLASATVAPAVFPLGGPLVPVTFAEPASVVAGIQYAIVLSADVGTQGELSWCWTPGTNEQDDIDLSYSGGVPLGRSPAGPWESAYTDDMSFRTYVVPLPPSSDTDGDGLSDSAETAGSAMGLKVRVATKSRCTPTLGVVATDPSKADTDGDGLSDGAEVNGTVVSQKVIQSKAGKRKRVTHTLYRSDPRNADTDCDGLSDGREVTGFNTRSGFCRPDPANFNTDFAKVADGWEYKREKPRRQNPCKPD